MSTAISTTDQLKANAKLICQFIKEKYGVDVSHGHGLELASKLEGHKDWNTASAKLKAKAKPIALPFKVRTVGDMRTALAPFKDADIVDGMYEFKVKDFLDSLQESEASWNDLISQEFSMVLERL